MLELFNREVIGINYFEQLFDNSKIKSNTHKNYDRAIPFLCIVLCTFVLLFKNQKGKLYTCMLVEKIDKSIKMYFITLITIH